MQPDRSWDDVPQLPRSGLRRCGPPRGWRRDAEDANNVVEIVRGIPPITLRMDLVRHAVDALCDLLRSAQGICTKYSNKNYFNRLLFHTRWVRFGSVRFVRRVALLCRAPAPRARTTRARLTQRTARSRRGCWLGARRVHLTHQ